MCVCVYFTCSMFLAARVFLLARFFMKTLYGFGGLVLVI